MRLNVHVIPISSRKYEPVDTLSAQRRNYHTTSALVEDLGPGMHLLLEK